MICSARRAKRLETIVEELGEGAIALELDVTSNQSTETLLDRLPNEWRDIDILVNNAGHDIGGRRLFHEGTSQGWSAIIETNVIGLMRVTQAVLEGMVRRDSGHIVNIGSIAGVQTSPLVCRLLGQQACCAWLQRNVATRLWKYRHQNLRGPAGNGQD